MDYQAHSDEQYKGQAGSWLPGESLRNQYGAQYCLVFFSNNLGDGRGWPLVKFVDDTRLVESMFCQSAAILRELDGLEK